MSENTNDKEKKLTAINKKEGELIKYAIVYYSSTIPIIQISTE